MRNGDAGVVVSGLSGWEDKQIHRLSLERRDCHFDGRLDYWGSELRA